MIKINENYTLQMVKGFDKNRIQFTAFILSNNDKLIEANHNIKIDLTKSNIIYKMKGWNIDQKIIDDIISYVKHQFI